MGRVCCVLLFVFLAPVATRADVVDGLSSFSTEIAELAPSIPPAPAAIYDEAIEPAGLDLSIPECNDCVSERPCTECGSEGLAGVLECPPPDWMVRAGVVFLTRGRNEQAVIIEDPVGANLMDSSDFAFDREAAPEVALRHRVAENFDIEFRYLGEFSWISNLTTQTIAGTSIAIPGGTPFLLTGPGTMRSRYDSGFATADVSVRRRIQPGFNSLVGLRWASLSERLLMNQPLTVGVLDIDTRMRNRMLGLQVGADGEWGQPCGLGISYFAKSAIMFNQTSAHTVATAGTSLPVTTTGRTQNVVFLGEIGLEGIYRFNCNFAVRGGYRLVWLRGVVTAGAQAAATNAAVDTNTTAADNLMFHGFTLHAEVRW